MTRVHVGTSSRSVQQVVFVFTFSLSAPRIHDGFIFQKPNKKNDLKKWRVEFLAARGLILFLDIKMGELLRRL